MAIEKLTTYTEYADELDRISATAARVTGANVSRNLDARLGKDFGVNYWGGDWGFLYDVLISAVGSSQCKTLLLSQAQKNSRTIYNDNEHFQCAQVQGGIAKFGLTECDGGALYADATADQLQDTVYYNVFSRDEDVGSYGEIEVLIYSNSARTVLVDTLTVTLHTAKRAFRFFYAVNSWDDNTSNTISFYVENIDLQQPALVPIMRRRGRA